MGETEEDKRGLDGRFASAQTALLMQEETIRRKSPQSYDELRSKMLLVLIFESHFSAISCHSHIDCNVSFIISWPGNDRDRKQMQDKINNLERNLNASNSECGQLNDRVNKFKQVCR